MTAGGGPKFEWRILTGMGVLGTLLIITPVLTYYNTRQLNDNAWWVAHTHEVLGLTADVLLALVDAETGERGFIITGNDEFLQPYNAALARLDGRLARLKVSIGNNDLQQERIGKLEEMVRARLAQLNQGIDLRRKSEQEARAFLMAKKGKVRMEAIRELIETMKREETDLLEQRERRSIQAYRIAVTTTLVTALVGLGILGTFVWFLHRGLLVRHKAAAALYEQRELFHATLGSIGDAVIVADIEGKVKFVNAATQTMTGWQGDEALGQPLETVFRLIDEETREPVANLTLLGMRDCKAVGRAKHTVLIARDGTERPIANRVAPIKDATGLAAGVVLTFQDVSEQRRSEAGLREVENRFRQLADSIPQLVWMAKADGHITWYNKQWYEYTGTNPEQMEGWGWQSVHDPVELPKVLERWRASLATGEPFEMVFPLRRADGQFGSFLTRIMPIRSPEGQILNWFGTNTDITERVQIEASLRRSQEEAQKNQEILKLVHQIGRIGHWEWNSLTNENKWSPEIEALYGLPPGGFEGGYEGWTKLLHPDDLAKAEEDVRRAMETGEYFTEFRVVWPDGSIHYLETRANVLKDAEGRAGRIVGVNMDITVRKQVEEALKKAHEELEQRVRDRTAELTEVNQRLCQEIEEHRATEARLREHTEEIETLMEVLPVPVWITHDPECRKMTGNRATYELTRMPRGANVSQSAPEEEKPSFRVVQGNRQLAPEDLPMQRATATGIEVRNAELDLVFEDGSIRSIFGFAAPLFGPQRQVRGCIGAFIDITERRQLENRLRESEERYRAVVEDQTEVVSRMRADGTFLFVNDVYCRTFGKAPVDLLGKQWVPVAHPEDVASIEGKLARLSPENPIIQVENRVYDAAGQVRWMEFVNRGFFSPGGQLTEIQAVGRDVTERKQIEERLRTSLGEKGALLKEVHHRVKNNLAITVSLLNFEIRKASDTVVIETLRRAQNRVRSMAMVHELLYRSESLAGIELLAYVKQLTRQLLISYDVANRIRVEVCVPPIELLLDVAIPFGLILNELVSNTCKHAYPAPQSGRLLISVNQEPGGFVRLIVADDGMGVPDGVNPISSHSLGLRLVRDLIEQLGGSLEFIRSPGTSFHIRFPTNSGTKA